VRLFVGVRPPAEVERVLAGVGRPERPGVRWTCPHQWHVTLRFLGEVPDEEVASVAAALGAVGGRCGPRHATLGPVTRRLGRAVLVAPVSGLDDLAAAVVESSAGFGVAPEVRPFSGHLTLARGKGRRPVPADLAGEPVEAAWPVTSMELVRSHLGAGGARYEVVATVGLQGR
jgi:RNA 2',3'-cyclic 3'-phosphodiesterase